MAAKNPQKSEKKQRGKNPASLANLKPFTGGPDPRRNLKGMNVNGRADIMKMFTGRGNEIVELTINGKKQKMSRFEAIALALSSDKKYMVAFLEWATGGKLPQAMELTGTDGEALKIISIIKHDDNE